MLLKSELLTKEKIVEILSEHDYPKTPKEKFDNLFQKLYEFQSYDGQIVRLKDYVCGPHKLKDDNYFFYFYFRKYVEFKLYMETSSNDGYIYIDNNEYSITHFYQITYKGLNHYLEITEEGTYSNNCFVAMSFADEDYPIYRDAIQPECDDTGFITNRIDYEQ